RDWEDLSEARQRGIPIEAGDVLSEYTECHVDLTRYNQVIAATSHDAYNSLICADFIPSLERGNVFQTAVHQANPKRFSPKKNGNILINKDNDIHTLNNQFYDGAVLKQTKITNVFKFADYKAQHPEATIVYVITAEGKLLFN